jgi:hypothetical protein
MDKVNEIFKTDATAMERMCLASCCPFEYHGGADDFRSHFVIFQLLFPDITGKQILLFRIPADQFQAPSLEGKILFVILFHRTFATENHLVDQHHSGAGCLRAIVVAIIGIPIVDHNHAFGCQALLQCCQCLKRVAQEIPHRTENDDVMTATLPDPFTDVAYLKPAEMANAALLRLLDGILNKLGNGIDPVTGMTAVT